MLDRLRRAVRKKLLDAVFVYSPDRLSRDPLHQQMLVQEFQDHGVVLHFVEGKLEDTPEGRLVLYVQGYAGQKERSQIAERTMRGKRWWQSPVGFPTVRGMKFSDTTTTEIPRLGR